MSDPDGMETLRELLRDPNTTAEMRASITEAIGMLARANDAVRVTLAAEFPDCLQGLSETQKAAINTLCNQTAAAAIRSYGQQMAIETARLAASQFRQH